ncbi:hypothetical protein N9544_06500 [Flavobacteriales bacterium]|nr:hypothetical protein [Flavobacteriales bacterium]
MKSKLIFLVFISFLISCSGKSKIDVDISDQEIDFSVSRFDKELFEADIYNLRYLNTKWTSDYGYLYETFISQMMNIGLPQDPMITYRIEKFLSDSTINLIKKELDNSFSDFSTYEKELKDAFKHYSYYFPEKNIPKIVAFYSNFSGAKSFPFADTLGIGLDMFIGRNSDVVKYLPSDIYFQYAKDDMDPENLVSETVKSWIYYNFSERMDFINNSNYGIRKDFLSSIIYHGKMMVAIEAMMPKKSKATLFQYTQAEMDWCKRSEKQLYENLIEFKLVYTKNIKEIAAYINPGSFTPGLPPESPGGIGKWIGYRMVKQYFEENDITLQELLTAKDDERKILSFYNL